MSKTILILTVGGSHQPVLRSIQDNNPDFVHFLCSDDSGRTKGSYTQVIGDGKVLKSDPRLDKPDQPNIVTLANLQQGQFKIHKIKDFDNLEACYLMALNLIESLHAKDPDARIFADYTGGTKSMTAGLAAAALEDGACEIVLVRGHRPDLNKVADKTEYVWPLAIREVQVQRRLRIARDFISGYHYASAAHFVEETIRRYGTETLRPTLERWLNLCRAFDAWDRFDHASAAQLLNPYRAQFVDYARFLDAILEQKEARAPECEEEISAHSSKQETAPSTLAPKVGHGFELVEDLLRNAERRAAQGRYDDAVGRLYRAIELTAQIWLKERYHINTEDIDLAQVPSSSRTDMERLKNSKGKIKIGLQKAWDLIAAFPDDPLGKHYTPARGRIWNFLQSRNDSLFAHGLSPIGESQYRAYSDIIRNFLDQAINIAVAALGRRRLTRLAQFPTKWE